MMTIDINSPGRMLHSSKLAPEGHDCVWNANLCTKSKGKIWFGDIDLTDDEDDLAQIAKDLGEDVYVLRERDARFDTENDPQYDRAVAIISPAGNVVVALQE